MYQQGYVITVEREDMFRERRRRAQKRVLEAQRRGAIQGGALVLLAALLAAVVAMSCNRQEQQAAAPVPTMEIVVHEHVTVSAPPAVIQESTEMQEPVENWNAEAEVIAKTVYGEARGCSATEQAAVVWCILNRVDDTSGLWPDDIIGVATQDSQFHGYSESHPVEPELYALGLDVIARWQQEKAGESDVGRVLPKEYCYFTGDGLQNTFRTEWRGGTTWDWSLPSPYEE